MGRGAWGATVHGVARVGHDLATKEKIILFFLFIKIYTTLSENKEQGKKGNGEENRHKSEKSRVWSQMESSHSLADGLRGCVSLGRSLPLSDDHVHFIGFRGRRNEIMDMEGRVQRAL